jgi:hypothetical protein
VAWWTSGLGGPGEVLGRPVRRGGVWSGLWKNYVYGRGVEQEGRRLFALPGGLLPLSRFGCLYSIRLHTEPSGRATSAAFFDRLWASRTFVYQNTKCGGYARAIIRLGTETENERLSGRPLLLVFDYWINKHHSYADLVDQQATHMPGYSVFQSSS